MTDHVTTPVSDAIREMAGTAALPRQNGELVFAAPWEGRVLGTAIALVQAHGLAWDDFRARLIAAIADAPDRPYYESWTAALEALVVDLGLALPGDIDTHAAAIVE